jgi:hypothetical protein
MLENVASVAKNSPWELRLFTQNPRLLAEKRRMLTAPRPLKIIMVRIPKRHQE